MVKANPHSNGNGSNSLARTQSPAPPPMLSIDPATTGELMKPPPWLQALRDAMADSIKADDITAVMAKQVEKAKEGDMKAAAFVMNQANKLMTTQAKQPPVTIVQNNYYDSPRPDEPIDPKDDKEGSIRKLRARARAGEPITGRPDDRRVQPVSDDEEKELRRRQQEQEDEDRGDPLRD